MLKKSLYAISFVLSFQGYLTADTAPSVVSNVVTQGEQNALEDYTSGQTAIKKIITQGVAEAQKELKRAKVSDRLADELNVAAIAESLKTKTMMGTWYLQEALAQPLAIEEREAALAKRVKIIKFLIEKQELKQKIDQLLQDAKEYEQDIIKLMSEYFKGKTCPELVQLEAMKKANQPGYALSEFMITNPTGRFINTALLGASIGYFSYMIPFIASLEGVSATSKAYPIALFGALAAFDGYVLNTTEYAPAVEKRKKMHALNRFISITQEIESICTNHDLHTQFKISDVQDENALNIINKLKASRYQEKDTLLFITPLVHGLLYDIYRNQQSLGHILVSVAEMDAYSAIATNIIASQNKDNKFCFAQFIEGEQPCVKSKGFWNMLVKNPVVNSINEDKSIILTGPNAGGKSTSIRSILQNILLAQTFGVAAAESFECTMFDMIESYLHISDDLIKGDSLFKAEVKRAQAILEKIKALEEGKKYFFALDELFTGTVAEDGEECAYQFVNRISEFKGIQFIYATHFKKLKEVGSDNPHCANYKVGAPARNEAGALVYPFTFMQGANEVNVAKEIAKDAGLFA